MRNSFVVYYTSSYVLSNYLFQIVLSTEAIKRQFSGTFITLMGGGGESPLIGVRPVKFFETFYFKEFMMGECGGQKEGALYILT